MTLAEALAFVDRMEVTFNLHGRAREEIDLAKPNEHKGVAFNWSQGIRISALVAAAHLDPAHLPGAQKAAKELDAYRAVRNGVEGYQVLPGPGLSEHYYDDNAWLVLSFVELYRLTHDPKDLERAKVAWGLVASGESPDLGGGIWWRDKHDSKNTCSNAPAIVAALELNSAAPDPKLVELARRLTTWTTQKFQDDDGLFFDGMNLKGEIGKAKWTYNSALMIRAHLLLHRLGEDKPVHLLEARRIATAAEAKWLRPRKNAPADNPKVLADDGPFAVYLAEALLDLATTDNDAARAQRVRDALQNTIAAPSPSGWYPKRWDEPAPKSHYRLIDQSAVARAWLLALPPQAK